MRLAHRWVMAASLLIAAGSLTTALADEPKHGGILKIYHRDNPPSASIHEEATYSTVIPFMPIFNNLVLYNQNGPQNSFDSIVPDLAESWSWSDDKTSLTFKLRHGVKWHDGKPFTANDVKCTFDLLMGKSKDSFRKNPRQDWYKNVTEVKVNGDDEVSVQLRRPQPALLALLASGYSPIYPCHVSARDMRLKPIGTGPFTFVAFNQNESIKITRNTDYWRPDRPYLDGVEFTIIPNRSTAILAFVAGKFDMTFPTEVSVPLMRDVKSQDPKAICELRQSNVANNVIINRDAPPFDNPDLRRAMALALDRKAFIDILAEGQADIGGSMLPAPEGVWGMPKEMLETIPGYGPDIAKSREEARAIMAKVGYGPEKPLKIKVSTRNIAVYRDPAVILIDQLKQIYMEGELEVVETGNWFSKVARGDYTVGLNLTGNAVDDPDQTFYENYSCGSERNYTHYCNKDLEKLFDQQSQMTDLEQRKKLVWEIDKKLQEDVARPIIFHIRAGTCWKPDVKGVTIMV
ncbi:MAG: peptide ABC transporter substrate-binding protein, partial [Alphaproteobacteria bacterium]